MNKQSYNEILELDEFDGVREQLNILTMGISSGEIFGAQHDRVEEWIDNGTTEFARRLFQAHLDLRAKNQPTLTFVESSDGTQQDERRSRTRDLESVFGEVKVDRNGYGAAGRASIFPLDCELNLPKRKYSYLLQYKLVKEGTKQSYDESVKSIQETTGGKVPKLQAEQIMIASTVDFESFYALRQAKLPEHTTDPLIMSIDQKGVVMRKEWLREATRKAAGNENHKHTTRLSKGEKRQRKRMSTVATVYTVARHPRTAEMIIGLTDCQKEPEPKAREKRVWASIERDALTVTDEMLTEALRRDPELKRPWVILLDGAEAQLRNVMTVLKNHGVKDVVIILDFIHVLEYLWKAAHALFDEGSVAAEEWVQKQALQILHGNASEVARGMRQSATKRGLTTEQRKAIDSCAGYLIKYKKMLRYDQYLSQGLPIATGVIEGACRSLVKDRMDVTGARWTLPGAEAVLKARSLRSSRDFDAYWDYHKKKELERNHLSVQRPVKLAA